MGFCLVPHVWGERGLNSGGVEPNGFGAGLEGI